MWGPAPERLWSPTRVVTQPPKCQVMRDDSAATAYKTHAHTVAVKLPWQCTKTTTLETGITLKIATIKKLGVMQMAVTTGKHPQAVDIVFNIKLIYLGGTLAFRHLKILTRHNRISNLKINMKWLPKLKKITHHVSLCLWYTKTSLNK